MASRWLVHSEVLHYGYALIMLILCIPRLELHLFYNTVVFVPMMVAMYYHLLPSAPDAARMRCGCALHPHPATT